MDKIESADKFLTRKKVMWLDQVSITVRKKIYQKLRKVDPRGLVALHNLRRSVHAEKGRERYRKKRMKSAVPLAKDVKEHAKQAVAVIEAGKLGTNECTRLIFTSAESIYQQAAMLMAVGRTPAQTAEILHVDSSDIIQNVTRKDVQKAKKQLGPEVIYAADRVVLDGLLAGEVDPKTADLIAHRRRKLILDANAEQRETEMMKSEIAARRAKYEERFGTGVMDADSDAEQGGDN